jgi:hypothetical protein
MITKLVSSALLVALATATAAAQVSGSRRDRPDTTIDAAPILAAALADVRREFAFGRVVLDRVVADTTKRLAPPLVSKREHKAPEGWAKVNEVETVPTELAEPVCNVLKTECRLQSDIVGAIGLSDVTMRGDTARVIARTAETVGTGPYRVRVTVLELSLLRNADGDWRVRKSRIRATG